MKPLQLENHLVGSSLLLLVAENINIPIRRVWKMLAEIRVFGIVD